MKWDRKNKKNIYFLLHRKMVSVYSDPNTLCAQLETLRILAIEDISKSP